MAEACGSRTQTFDSQPTANDDVTASAKFQLESIGVRTVHLLAKLCLINGELLPYSLFGLFSDGGNFDLFGPKLPSFRTSVRFPSPAP